MINLLIKDLDKEMTEAKVAEKDAQADYEQMLSDSAKKDAGDGKKDDGKKDDKKDGDAKEGERGTIKEGEECNSKEKNKGCVEKMCCGKISAATLPEELAKNEENKKKMDEEIEKAKE